MRGPTRCVTVIVIALAVPAFLGAPAWGGEPLSKKEFLKQGNAICADLEEQVGTLAEELFGPYENSDTEPPPEVIDAFAAGLVPAVRQAMADIDALQPPTKDEKKVQKIIDAWTDTADTIESDPSILLEQGSAYVFRKADRLARKYGLKVCSDGA